MWTGDHRRFADREPIVSRPRPTTRTCDARVKKERTPARVAVSMNRPVSLKRERESFTACSGALRREPRASPMKRREIRRLDGVYFSPDYTSQDRVTNYTLTLFFVL